MKIKIDLEAINVEKKINTHITHFCAIWIEHSRVMLSHGPLLLPKKTKPTS